MNFCATEASFLLTNKDFTPQILIRKLMDNFVDVTCTNKYNTSNGNLDLRSAVDKARNKYGKSVCFLMETHGNSRLISINGSPVPEDLVPRLNCTSNHGLNIAHIRYRMQLMNPQQDLFYIALANLLALNLPSYIMVEIRKNEPLHPKFHARILDEAVLAPHKDAHDVYRQIFLRWSVNPKDTASVRTWVEVPFTGYTSNPDDWSYKKDGHGPDSGDSIRKIELESYLLFTLHGPSIL